MEGTEEKGKREVCSQKILEMVYRNLVEGFLFFNMVAWYEDLDVKYKGKLTRVVNTASKINGRPQMSLGDSMN